MNIDEWMPTTTLEDDSFNLRGVAELEAKVPIVHVYAPPLFERPISRSNILPFNDSHIRPEEEQSDAEYWINYKE